MGGSFRCQLGGFTSAISPVNEPQIIAHSNIQPTLCVLCMNCVCMLYSCIDTENCYDWELNCILGISNYVHVVILFVCVIDIFQLHQKTNYVHLFDKIMHKFTYFPHYYEPFSMHTHSERILLHTESAHACCCSGFADDQSINSHSPLQLSSVCTGWKMCNVPC